MAHQIIKDNRGRELGQIREDPATKRTFLYDYTGRMIGYESGGKAYDKAGRWVGSSIAVLMGKLSR